MLLACVQLVNAGILMIDDTTGHLNVKNIQLEKQRLGNVKGSTIVTSANTVLLNEMCTHIVDFHDRISHQLKDEKGKVLEQVVELYPEKASCFELSSKNDKSVFPLPGSIEGVESRGKTILKMRNVTFKYPILTSRSALRRIPLQKSEFKAQILQSKDEFQAQQMELEGATNYRYIFNEFFKIIIPGDESQGGCCIYDDWGIR